MKRLKILLFQFEFTVWQQARSYPYCLNLGFVDALRAQGVDVTFVTSPWRTRLTDICKGKQFDQVWFNDLSHFAERAYLLDQIAELAPVRVGFATESLTYSDAEREAHPWLSRRDKMLPTYIDQMTHVVAVDEWDVQQIHQHYQKPTMWHPVPMPQQFIRTPSSPALQQIAYFSGSIYGERERWLKTPELQSLMAYQPSTNSGRVVQSTFDFMHQRVPFLKGTLPRLPLKVTYRAYNALLRRIRSQTARQWIAGMQQGAAIVNLPHLVKGYSSRVIEGIAAGRPVISWRVPDRPQNEALFEEGKEILLYSTPDELALHLKRAIIDPVWGAQIAANARQKLQKHHTATHRVGQILEWIKSGKQPIFA